MLGTVNVYYIWYGNWAGNTATTILTDFASSIGGSPYFNINTTYYDGAERAAVSNCGHVRRHARPTPTRHGTSLTDAQIQARGQRRDHQRRAAEGRQRRLLRAHLGRRDRVQRASAPSTAAGTPTAPSPAPTSSTASSATRTAARRPARRRPPARTATPAPTAWRRSSRTSSRRRPPIPTSTPGTTGAATRTPTSAPGRSAPTYTTANGAKANMKLGARDYLIQQNWVNAGGGYCAMSY